MHKLKKAVAKHKELILISAVAFILRGVLFLKIIAAPQLAFANDSYLYDKLGVNLAENGVFSGDTQPPYSPNTLRPPLYPVFIAVVYKIFGHQPAMVIFLQCLVSVFICWGIYYLGAKIFYPKVGLLAGFFYALDLPSIDHTNLLLTETLFTFILMFSVYFLIICRQGKSRFFPLMSGLLLGLCTLCRPLPQYLFLPLVLVFLLGFKPAKKALINYLVFTAGFLVVIMPWLIRNYALTGIFDLTTIQGAVLFNQATGVKMSVEKKRFNAVNFREMTERLHDEIETRYGHLSQKTPTEIDRIYKKESLDIILQHPFVYLTNVLTGSLIILTESDYYTAWRLMGLHRGKIRNIFKRLVEFYNIIFTLLLWAGILYAIWILLKEKQYFYLSFFGLIITYFTVLATNVDCDARYRVPLIPYIAILGSYGLLQYYDHKRLANKRRDDDGNRYNNSGI
ncbi:MAG: glycosyltransferase family 39 protein [Planctomycetes bacterium]|nr:glycosyltransferase family 39 protein [Planctomycetota bacterium]